MTSSITTQRLLEENPAGVMRNIPTTKPYFPDDDIRMILNDIETVLKSGRLILGPFTQQFEQGFKEYCGVKHAVAVSSCTAALEIALKYFGVSQKEVILPTNTFVATANAVLNSGGTPVLADISPDSLCLSAEDLMARITPQTRGVIIVHLAGFIDPEVGRIREICSERGLFLLEDAAHAHGASRDGSLAGSIGQAGCFSMYPTKVMTTSTGGMITTNDEGLADYAISLRHHGVGQHLENIVNHGNDWLMSEIHAVLGVYQLRRLDASLKRRNEIAQIYDAALRGMKSAWPVQVATNGRHSYYKYPVQLSDRIDKSDLISQMKERYGIKLGSSYDPPCHLQPLYQTDYHYHEGMFPTAERTLKQVVALPMFVEMTNEQAEHVTQCLKGILLDSEKDMIPEALQEGGT